MPVHDWTRADAGIFHDFHQSWITEIKKALNGGILPAGYYALAEQSVAGPRPDVLTLQQPLTGIAADDELEASGGIAVASAPPKTRYHTRLEEEAVYAQTVDTVFIRHRSGHEVVAIIEIVSRGLGSLRGRRLSASRE